MTGCGLGEGIELEFLATGTRIRPRESDIRAEARNYARATFELSEEAGKFISNNVPQASPVIIKFDGVDARRMYYPRDAISFRSSLNDITVSELTLEDPRKVLSRGVLSKMWGTARVGKVVDYIMKERDDPHGVITDYEFVTKEKAGIVGVSSIITGNTRAQHETNIAQAYVAGFDTEAGEAVIANFDLDDISPLSGMQRATSQLGLNWWVDIDGTLRIGIDGTYGNLIGSVAGDNGVALKRYSVTQGSEFTDTVMVKGSFNVPEYDTRLGYSLSGKDLQVIAEASTTEVSGTSMVLEAQRKVESPNDIRDTATRTLIEEIMGSIAGSLVVNGGASTDTEILSKVDIGDVLFIGEGISTSCNQNVSTGTFIVRSLQHIIDTRRGWEINMNVARFPDMDQITSKSVIYDPVDNKRYDDFQAYKAANEKETNQSGL